MDMLIGLMVMAGVPAYFVAQPVALLNWRGGWRKAAAAPLMLSVPAAALQPVRPDAGIEPVAADTYHRGRTRHDVPRHALARAVVALLARASARDHATKITKRFLR
jgi:hypothetical protein